MKDPARREASRMTAMKYDPRIGVHVLSEFIYCPRAGLIAFEQDADDNGEELSGILRFDYLPRYELARIEAAIQLAFGRFWKQVGGAAMTLAVTVVLMLLVDREMIWIGVFVLALLGCYLFDSIKRIATLVRRRSIALVATPNEPELPITQRQEIDWWELREAGFVPRKYDAALEDDEWKLAGKPWAVLCKADLRIPVLRRHREDRTYYPQHVARLAAYCHLIEKEIGATCPYGIILWGQSYAGLAIPIGAAERKIFHDGLVEAREVLRQVAERREPVAPNSSRCDRCPLGAPQRYRAGETDNVLRGVQLPIVGIKGNDRHVYHSCCGDRFQWTPPHARAFVRGILART